ncbi:hypothetical protein [Mariprofundus ferrooxydans]|uniref:Uncharacterized protein n=1 Tax=Mariprofundus ferrooxydans PV-1 TaxID=314345 RepID=Q0F279_9PROT|nr:hypothetical protein [Mariprofundus ferrooxydans]EAU55671.1 hypothetical protein SPV1_01947 [Mariprofundus ferrooxydans PV-1]KON48600.1 hypothetical protein AL013_01095 [Mariprofundus ferrooxydans]
MIILPASTPAAVVDFGNLNQSQQNQVSQSEQSRKATDTVQLSPQSRQLAGAQLHNSPTQNSQPVELHIAAEKEATEKVADNEAVEQARPVNPQTQKPETTKIDLLA